MHVIFQFEPLLPSRGRFGVHTTFNISSICPYIVGRMQGGERGMKERRGGLQVLCLRCAIESFISRCYEGIFEMTGVQFDRLVSLHHLSNINKCLGLRPRLNILMPDVAYASSIHVRICMAEKPRLATKSNPIGHH